MCHLQLEIYFLRIIFRITIMIRHFYIENNQNKLAVLELSSQGIKLRKKITKDGNSGKIDMEYQEVKYWQNSLSTADASVSNYLSSSTLFVDVFYISIFAFLSSYTALMTNK